MESKQFVMNGLLCPVCEKGVINQFRATVCFAYTSTNDVDIHVESVCPFCGEYFHISNDRMLTVKDDIVTVYPFHVLEI